MVHCLINFSLHRFYLHHKNQIEPHLIFEVMILKKSIDTIRITGVDHDDFYQQTFWK